MSQRFKTDGAVVPVTLIKISPSHIVQVKIPEKDGYFAVQVGAFPIKKMNKPEAGHLKDLSLYGVLKEFRVDSVEGFEKGKDVNVDQFELGDKVSVTGISKGKGFQGVVKRHGFSGGPASHGHKDQLRMPGSIGAKGVARVFKGTRMAGRMGTDQVTVKNLEVIEIDKKNNVLAVKGAIPGHRNSLVYIESM